MEKEVHHLDKDPYLSYWCFPYVHDYNAQSSFEVPPPLCCSLLYVLSELNRLVFKPDIIPEIHDTWLNQNLFDLILSHYLHETSWCNQQVLCKLIISMTSLVLFLISWHFVNVVTVIKCYLFLVLIHLIVLVNVHKSVVVFIYSQNFGSDIPTPLLLWNTCVIPWNAHFLDDFLWCLLICLITSLVVQY